ncbi:hypothetical protein FQN55_003166 [Onygenales sp. PD_40]|nr:hypothetical protein FQN55_003166 [Onygenales sp. PD_40]KAK2778987.1 hypothetical protein FQN52_002656 [Onygenales sp. PD_12]KAK2781758.1 hypothetical protein FQN53_000442 [Emmonsiellopsis sp. PD_33]
MKEPMSPHCKTLASPNPFNFALSILFLFILFFPRATPSHLNSKPSDVSPNFRIAILVVVTCIGQTIATAIVAVIIIVAHPAQRQFCANIFGILAALLSSIQYFPQIYTTFRLRRVGSLSIPMMCIQTPGSLVWAASLAARLGTEGWSSWGVYVVTALLQGTLLAMGIYFEYINPVKGDSDTDSDEVPPPPEYNAIFTANSNEQGQDREQEPSEETPLLQGSA